MTRGSHGFALPMMATTAAVVGAAACLRGPVVQSMTLPPIRRATIRDFRSPRTSSSEYFGIAKKGGNANNNRNRGSRAALSLSVRGGDAPSSDGDGDGSQDETIISRQRSRLTREFFSIAAPAFVQLAAEPLAGLIDTAYLGRLGPEVLGGAGVAISAQYAVGKLYNDPLLRTSISLVASEDGRKKSSAGGGGRAREDDCGDDALSIAVSSALLLAFAVGAVQLVLYFSFAGMILRGMGVSPPNAMHHPAHSYLRVRALGTPAATLWLVTNGVFRGLGDTSTPLKYSILFTALNAVLDPLFIFTLKFGASGAAAGTAIAQYAALVPLILSLNRRVKVDVVGQWKKLGGTLKEYVSAGSYVLLRTVGKVLAYSVCARQAVSNSSEVAFLRSLVGPTSFKYLNRVLLPCREAGTARCCSCRGLQSHLPTGLRDNSNMRIRSCGGANASGEGTGWGRGGASE